MSKINDEWRKPRVIIIGGGIAGFSAAQRLSHHGLNNILLLEATDRPGGRVLTHWMGDTVVELGADTIWGASASNSIYDLAVSDDLLCGAKPVTEMSNLYFSSNGRLLVPTGVEEDLLAELLSHIKSHLNPTSDSQDNIMDLINMRLQQHLKTFSDSERDGAERILLTIGPQLRNRWGADLSRISTNIYAQHEECAGPDVQIPLGFGGILSALIRELPDDSVKYNKEVDYIRWQSEPGPGPRVVVRACDGEKFCGDYAIVAVPLGVLKVRKDSFIRPIIPKSKLEAIESLGFGQVCKIFIEYASPWWLNVDGKITVCWSFDELQGSEWIKGISSFAPVRKSKTILGLTVGGSYATCVEQLREEEIAVEITKVIRRILNNPTIPYPNALVRTTWGTDRNFFGTNTYMDLESCATHFNDIHDTLPESGSGRPPIVFFVGEHADPKHFGTVHAARKTGCEVADHIVQLTRKFEGPPIEKKEAAC